MAGRVTGAAHSMRRSAKECAARWLQIYFRNLLKTARNFKTADRLSGEFPAILRANGRHACWRSTLPPSIPPFSYIRPVSLITQNSTANASRWIRWSLTISTLVPLCLSDTTATLFRRRILSSEVKNFSWSCLTCSLTNRFALVGSFSFLDVNLIVNRSSGFRFIAANCDLRWMRLICSTAPL